MRRPCRLAIVVLAVVLAMSGAIDGAGATERSRDHAALRRALRANLAAHPAVPGEAAAVLAPGVDAEAAVGEADRATHRRLTTDTPFRIASVTKTFVAVAALRLVEQGRLDLDVPIGPELSAPTAALLAGGGYDPDAITLRQLLDHTAGLADYAASARYDAANRRDPGRRWTPEDQLRLAMDLPGPLAPPGVRYHYDDTGYVLAGEIVSRAAGAPLPAAVRALDRFDELGLTHTWWESLEPAPAGLPPLAHQYAGSFDGATLDPTFDLFGGGGLASTAGDVAAFFAALFAGRVFDDPATLRTMQEVSAPGRRADAALGLFRTRVAGRACWGHPGWWGTEAYHCAGPDTTFAVTVNQADEARLDTTSVQRAALRLGRRR